MLWVRGYVEQKQQECTVHGHNNTPSPLWCGAGCILAHHVLRRLRWHPCHTYVICLHLCNANTAITCLYYDTAGSSVTWWEPINFKFYWLLIQSFNLLFDQQVYFMWLDLFYYDKHLVEAVLYELIGVVSLQTALLFFWIHLSVLISIWWGLCLASQRRLFNLTLESRHAGTGWSGLFSVTLFSLLFFHFLCQLNRMLTLTLLTSSKESFYFSGWI